MSCNIIAERHIVLIGLNAIIAYNGFLCNACGHTLLYKMYIVAHTVTSTCIPKKQIVNCKKLYIEIK